MADETPASSGTPEAAHEAAAPPVSGPPASAQLPHSRETARSIIERTAIEQFESRPRDTGIRRTGTPVRVVHAPEPTREWIVVVPVKGTVDAKSRLGGDPDARAALALAIALDTVEAALEASAVVGVLVVTSVAVAAAFDETDAFVVLEDEPAGLDSAIDHGLATAAELAGPGRGVAILLGDLPALDPAELGAALDAARGHERAMVPDAEGTGTVLATAADGITHAAAFGEGSAAAHRAAGYDELTVEPTSGLRRDVDTADQLASLTTRLRPRTAAALAARP